MRENKQMGPQPGLARGSSQKAGASVGSVEGVSGSQEQAGVAGPSRPSFKTAKQLAAVLGVSSRTIRNWKAAGMPVKPDGTYDLVAVVEWRARREADKATRRDRPRDLVQAFKACRICREALLRGVAAAIGGKLEAYYGRVEGLLDAVVEKGSRLVPAEFRDAVRAGLRRFIDERYETLSACAPDTVTLPDGTVLDLCGRPTLADYDRWHRRGWLSEEWLEALRGRFGSKASGRGGGRAGTADAQPGGESPCPAGMVPSSAQGLAPGDTCCV